MPITRNIGLQSLLPPTLGGAKFIIMFHPNVDKTYLAKVYLEL